jgi:Flp pilus assembly protein TadB
LRRGKGWLAEVRQVLARFVLYSCVAAVATWAVVFYVGFMSPTHAIIGGVLLAIVLVPYVMMSSRLRR